jgi:hypothetical protein
VRRFESFWGHTEARARSLARLNCGNAASSYEPSSPRRAGVPPVAGVGHPSSPSGIETAASWLGSSGSIEYAQDFIDATDWSHISNPWQLPNWEGSPYTMVWGVPMLPCGSPSTQCATNVSDYDEVANGGADSYFKTLAQNLISAGRPAATPRVSPTC